MNIQRLEYVLNSILTLQGAVEIL